MEKVTGYDEYEEDFRSVVLKCYHWLPEEMLSESLEGWEKSGILEVSVPDYLTSDKCGYTFLFHAENGDKGGMLLSYTGFY